MSPLLKEIFLILTIVGAVNWGLVGLFQLDLVAKIFGANTIFSRIVYSLVGLSGLMVLYFYFINPLPLVAF